MMTRVRWSVALALIALGVPGVAEAQSKALVLFVNGGRWTTISNLGAAGDRFTADWTYGGGVGLQLSPKVAFRASAMRLRTTYIGDTITPDDRDVTRVYYMGDLQVGWPTATGWAPYVYFGAGAVATDPDDASLESFTDFVSRGGIGVNYLTKVGVLFLEMDGWLWRLNSLDVSFEGVKFEFSVRMGYAFVIPF
jgi:hypothetical protein